MRYQNADLISLDLLPNLVGKVTRLHLFDTLWWYIDWSRPGYFGSTTSLQTTSHDLKGPGQPPPFSMPSKLLILHGEVKSECFTIRCGSESTFNYF